MVEITGSVYNSSINAYICNASIYGATASFVITGAQGIQGIQGIIGIQGTDGYQGSDGVQGAQGSQGSQGTQGIQGTDGTQGTQGIQGSQGTQGIQGIQGVQGISFSDASLALYVQKTGDTITGNLIINASIGINNPSPGASLDISGNIQLSNNSFIKVGFPSITGGYLHRSFIQGVEDAFYSGISLRYGSTSYGAQSGPELLLSGTPRGNIYYHTNISTTQGTLLIGNYTNNELQSLVLTGGTNSYSNTWIGAAISWIQSQYNNLNITSQSNIKIISGYVDASTPTIMCTSTGMIGIRTLIPAYTLDVSGTFHSKGSVVFDSSLNMSSQRITSLASPIDIYDAVNKTYVDSSMNDSIDISTYFYTKTQTDASFQSIFTFNTKNSSANGYMGQISYDASYFYVCTSTNIWCRLLLENNY